ncbi:MAG: YbdD/YjiX family protein [Actinomycetia bacterium]|nr:YbdD/YjiX family protein [Actinomycetes bacterium]
MAVAARAWRAFVWYVKSVLGENDYERYVAHLRAHHPDAPVPTVSAYWRDRYAREDAHPEGRCC